MNRFASKFLSFHLLAAIFAGLSLVVLCSFYFFNVSAQTETTEKSAEQNLIGSKLLIVKLRAGMYNYEKTLFTSNPDGLDVMDLPSLGFSDTPAWSADGTKIVLAGRQNTSQSVQDIYTVNFDRSGGYINLTNTNDANETEPSWSATGKIAYERNSQIWTMNADGSGQAQFTAITRASPFAPAWSPDGTKLAFASGGDIWVINADGTNERQVTVNPSSDSAPDWSPDGSKIAFVKGGIGIAVINADGTGETVLSSNGDSNPSWSPDGLRIAFRRSNSTNNGIYTMSADGTNQLRIFTDQILFPTPCCDTQYLIPVWQPIAQSPNSFTISGRVSYSNTSVVGATVNLSGTVNAATTTDSTGNYQFSNLPAGGNYRVSPSFPRHYFTPPNRSFNNLTSNQAGNFEVLGVCAGGNCVKNNKIAYVSYGDIYSVNADSTGEVNLTNTSSTGDYDPNYSSDGSTITFSTNRDGNYEIYRMNADGNNPVRLTNNSNRDSSPYYSPDGASIIFVSDRDGNNEIYKMNTDGSNQTRLTNETADDILPSFSPDGSNIIFISRRLGKSQIYKMNADGSNQQPLLAPTYISPCYDRPSYSLDGSKIIVSFSPDCTTAYQSTVIMNSDGSNRVESGVSNYATFSPDGFKAASVCCNYNNPNSPPRLSTYSVSGGSALTFPRAFAAAPDWQGLRAPRPTAFDFDGDSRSDISVFRPSNSAWYLLRSTAGMWVPVWGTSSDVLTPADFDGDLKTDVAVWRPSEGKYYILNSFDLTVRIEGFGLAGDIPTGGDWDGDGKADPAVFRGGAQGIFYYRGSMGNPNGNITSIPWGTSGDKAVAADYDGDGKTDAAVYRNGEWYIYKSSNGQFLGVAFGISSDKAVPADYDGDGKADIAVYRDGVWYQLRSTQGFAAFQFGIASDVPTPGDYDGDGKADAAVYRDGIWWILNSQNSTAQAVALGINTDKPLPSVFVR